MIAIFSNIKTAQGFSNKVYDFIMRNCPNAFGDCWQVPVANKDKSAWCVEIPAEYYKELYKDATKIIAATAVEYDKKTKVGKKPDPSFTTAEAVKL